MNIKAVFFFLFMFLSCTGFSQVSDTLLVTVTKEEKLQNELGIYTITIKNFSNTPVCILHSIFINLFYGPPQRLAVFNDTDSMELYSLEYSARDTLMDYEGPIKNFNAELILPLQEIKFEIALFRSRKEKKLKFEYAWVENFCYPEFKNEIYKDATQWYRKYKRIQRIIELP